jgi:AbrB family looped-hinge helix DNA binding protein
MMVEKVLDEQVEVIDHNGTAYISIPKRWREKLNIEPGDEVTRAILLGKHGYHLGVWNHEEQPTPDDREL